LVAIMTTVVSDDEDAPPLLILGAAVDEDGHETSSAADEVDNNEKKDVDVMEAMVDVEVTNTDAGDAGEGGIKQAPVLESVPPVIDVDAPSRKRIW
jgi:hypothetical protein